MQSTTTDAAATPRDLCGKGVVNGGREGGGERGEAPASFRLRLVGAPRKSARLAPARSFPFTYTIYYIYSAARKRTRPRRLVLDV